MNFLRKELITNDLIRFSKGLEEKISNSQVEPYEGSLPKGEVALGYLIKVGRNSYKVYMPYVVNEYNEHAVTHKKWSVEENELEITDGYPTLQEVIDFINEKHWASSIVIKSWRDIEGEWNKEPDLLEMKDKGCHILVVRHSAMGNLNGYVGININNPLFFIDYDNRKLSDTWVHGGLTFAGLGDNMPSGAFKKSYWYFGFDTAHAFDQVPSMIAVKQNIPQLGMFDMGQSFFNETYRNIEYVSEQAKQLATQLKGIVESQPKHFVNHKKMYRKLHNMKKAK